MIAEEMYFLERENCLWRKIGEHFGCDKADAIKWFLDGAPITLMCGRKPYANMSKLEAWLKKKYFIPTEKRQEVLEEVARTSAIHPPF